MRILPEDEAMLAAIAARESEIVGRAVDWCAINSGSRNLEGLERQRSVLFHLLRSMAGEARTVPLQPSVVVGDDGAAHRHPHPDALLLTVRPDADVQVVMTGHYDTVYPAGSRFQTVVDREDGALWGPGIADMKGGISVMLAAVEAFEAHPLKDRVGVRILLTPDEEIGNPASAPLLAELGATAHVGMTFEPSMPDGSLAAERKGSANWHLAVRGKAAHAGRDFASGRNAVAAAAALATELHALNGRREGVTVNVAAVSGGGPLNVVPDAAVVRFNARVPDQAAADWTKSAVEAIASHPPFEGITLELHGGFTRPPKPFDEAQQALFAAIRKTGALLGQSIAWKPSGGVCEGNNLHAAGLPNVDTLGVRGGDIHSENEYAWPESFVERARLSALILAKIASGEVDAKGIKALREPGV